MNIEEAGNELILNATQRKFIDHFNRVGRGGNARYLLNGEPGCGK
jgi:SpoVK/Ycf46/Vps4 family AAA+-type ATPase